MPRKPLPARHAGIVRMAAKTHLALLGHRNDPLEKIGDPLPHRVRADGPRFLGADRLAWPCRRRRYCSGPRRGPGGFGPHHAEEREVVLDGRDAGLGHVADHLAYGVDFPVALGLLPSMMLRILGPADGGAAQRQGHHAELDAETFDALPQLDQAGHGPVVVHRAGRKGATNVVDAQGGQDPQVGIGGVVLMAGLQQSLLGRPGLRGKGGWSSRGGADCPGSDKAASEELSAVHGHLLKNRPPFRRGYLVRAYLTRPRPNWSPWRMGTPPRKTISTIFSL